MYYVKTPEQQRLDDAVRAELQAQHEKEMQKVDKNERKILRFVFRHAIKSGLTVSCFDGEEWYLKRCTKINTIMDEIKATEEESFRFRKTDGTVFGFISCIYYNGNDGFDVISDSSASDEFEEWYKPIKEYIRKLEN